MCVYGCVCVCVFAAGSALCVYVCVCVLRFCKTNLSSAHRFSAIEPGFDHSATVNNAREVTAHFQQCVCVCPHVHVRIAFSPLLANSTEQFFNVHTLGPG